MTQKEARAESSGRRFPRAGWIVGSVLLFVAAGAFWLWSRLSRIRLSDGTTLTVAAVTVGTEHLEAQPVPWKLFGKLVGRGKGLRSAWLRTSVPSTLIWFDDLNVRDRYDLRLLDRHGWEWPPSSGARAGYIAPAKFPELEIGNAVQVVILDRSGNRLGNGMVPVTRVTNSPAPLGLPASMRRPDWRPASGESPPLPVTMTDGPLTATLKSVEMTVVREPASRCDVRLHLETLWGGKPFPREFGFVTITDQLGRAEDVTVQPDGRFTTTFSPLATTWDLHVQVLRAPGALLEPEDTVVVTPEQVEGAPFARQDGVTRGREWRVAVVPPGPRSLPLRFVNEIVWFTETIPVLFTEVEPSLRQSVEIEPLDARGERLPVQTIGAIHFPGNIHAIGCPTFDVAKGHRIRARFNVARQVTFSIRPDVASASERGAAP